MRSLWSRLMLSRHGATAIEYAIVAAVVALMVVAALELLQGSVGGQWNTVANSFNK